MSLVIIFGVTLNGLIDNVFIGHQVRVMINKPEMGSV